MLQIPEIVTKETSQVKGQVNETNTSSRSRGMLWGCSQRKDVNSAYTRDEESLNVSARFMHLERKPQCICVGSQELCPHGLT